jgi:hypothetical protein
LNGGEAKEVAPPPIVLVCYISVLCLGYTPSHDFNSSQGRAMKYLIQSEYIVPFLLSLVLINTLPMEFSWWAWILIFLAPDLSMIGYVVNNKVGAFTYNLFHHQLIAMIVYALGMVIDQPYLALAGLVLLGHSSLDRLLGYGLKREEGFKFTHLGTVGEK